MAIVTERGKVGLTAFAAACRISILLLLTAVLVSADWRPTGPFGGSVTVVQTDPTHPDTVIAASGNALLFRSRNGGDSWQPLPFPPQLRAVLHVFVIKADGTYLAGLGSDTPAYNGLFRSRDEGRTWNRLPGLANREIWSLAVWPADPDVIAAGSRDGVYLTRDGGQSWSRISPLNNRELQPVVSLAFDPKNANTLFAGTPHLPWKTTDGGTSWRSIHTGMIDDSDVFSIQVDQGAAGHVFATACSGIYFSANGGGGWNKLTGALGASYRTYVVAQNPKQPNMIYAGTTAGLIRSADYGRTWRRLSEDAARFIAFDPTRPGRIFIATDQRGVLRSDDNGDKLSGANEGLCNRYLSTMAPEGNDLFSASIYEQWSGGVFRLGADGIQWDRVAPASSLFGEQILSLAGGPGETLYAATYRSVLTSVDSGRTWSRISGPVATARLTALLPTSSGLLTASDSGIYRSGNKEGTWSKAQVPSGVIGIGSLVALDGTSFAAIARSGVLLSEDGTVWKRGAAIPGNPQIYGLVSPAENRLLAATSSGLMQSEDRGSSWQRVHWALENSTVSAICLDPRARSRVYLAQYGSVYQSADAGRTWSAVSADTSTFSIRALALVASQPSRLYALTQHQGIYFMAVPEIAPTASAYTAGLSDSTLRDTTKLR